MLNQTINTTYKTKRKHKDDETQNGETSRMANIGRKFKNFGAAIKNRVGIILRNLTTARSLKIYAVLIVILVVVGGLSWHFAIQPALSIKQSAEEMIAELGSLADEFGQRDLRQMDQRINAVTSKMDGINEITNRYDFLGKLGITKGYYDNLQVLRRLNTKASDLIKNLVPQIEPILATAGYRTANNPDVDTKNEQKVSQLVTQLPKLLELYERTEPKLLDLIAEIQQLDPNYIPAIGKYDYKDELIAAQQLGKEFPQLSEEFKAVSRVIPDLIGADKPANYLLIFQNEKEMRASGGILTAFGQMVVDKGEMKKVSANDMWDLFRDLNQYRIYPNIRNTNGQRFLMTFGYRCGNETTRPQDSGIFPDQQQTISRFREFYDRAANHAVLKKKYPQYEHVVTLNTLIISDLVKFVEPVEIKELKLTVTSENMAKVITEYLNNGDNKVGTSDRKDFMSLMADAIEAKLSSLSAKDLPEIVRAFLYNIQARHIAFYSKKSDIQAYFKEMEMLGTMQRAESYKDGDYFMHSEAQYCSLKSNMHVKNEVHMTINIQNDGTVKKSTAIKWWNPAFADSVARFIIDPSGQYPYTPWSRMVVLPGTTFVASDAKSRSGKFNYTPKQYMDNEIGGYVLEHVIFFKHVRKRGEDIKTMTYTTNYNAPSSIKYTQDKGYSLLLVKHPGKKEEKYYITINYKGKAAKYEYVLSRDTVITWKNNEFKLDYPQKKLDDLIDLTKELDTFLT